MKTSLHSYSDSYMAVCVQQNKEHKPVLPYAYSHEISNIKCAYFSKEIFMLLCQIQQIDLHVSHMTAPGIDLLMDALHSDLKAQKVVLCDMK